MAILGFLTHALPERAAEVEKELSRFPELTTYGIHKDCYLVVVADAPATEMEALVNAVRALEGVLALYVTTFSTEDEEEDLQPPAADPLPPDFS